MSLALALAACSGDGDPEGQPSTGSGESAGETTPGSDGETSGDTSDPDTSGDDDDDDDDDTGDSSGTADCELPEYEDDIALVLDEAVSAPGDVLHMVAAGETLVTCGDGFLAGVDPGRRALMAVELSGICRGLAYDGQSRVAATTSEGHVVLASVDADTGEVAVLDTAEDAGETLHGVGWAADQLLVAAGGAGLLSYTVADGALVPGDVVGELDDVRDVAIVDDRLLVANGFSGTRMLAADGSELAALETDGEAQGVVVDGDQALILRGFRGFDVVDVGESELQLLDSSTADGVALDASLRDGVILVSHTLALARYALGDDGLGEVSRQRRPGRSKLIAPYLLALADTDTERFVALGDEIVPVVLGEGAPAPNIEPVLPALLMRADVGADARAQMVYRNTGNADAIVYGWEGDDGFALQVDPDDLPPERPGCPGQYVVAPEALFAVIFVYPVASDEPIEGEVRLLTDDPDAPAVPGLALINRPTPDAGSDASELVMMTWHGEPFRLSDHFGKVIFLKLIAPL